MNMSTITPATGLVLALCAAVWPLHGQTVTTLTTFTGANGAYPYDALVQGTDGNFYGTTDGGKFRGQFYPGTVFRITPEGTLTTLKTLGHAYPYGGLVQASDGDFYGTTAQGGVDAAGTIFRMTPGGKFTTLYQCCANSSTCTGGDKPLASLVQANGDLYGTFVYDAIFKISLAGELTTLYSFPNLPEEEPWAGVIQATDGNFYGTTLYGGTPCPLYGMNGGCGTIYRMTPDGALTTLYNFCSLPNCADGATPYAGLVQASDGNLYGVAEQGGGTSCSPSGCGLGTAFRITLDGAFTLLAALNVKGADYPSSALIQATDGNLYGTACSGIFKMTPDGTVTPIYVFENVGCENGSPIQATDGNLYGTTVTGRLRQRRSHDRFGVPLVRRPRPLRQAAAGLGQGGSLYHHPRQ